MSESAGEGRRDFRFGLREIIPLGTMLVAIAAAYGDLKATIVNSDRRMSVIEARVDLLDARLQLSRPDPYHGADATRDFAIRDKVLDGHEQRLQRLEQRELKP